MKRPDLRPYIAAIMEHAATRQAIGWFRARSSREQRLLLGVATLSAGAIIYAGVWAPLNAHRSKNFAELTGSEILLAQVHAAGDSLNRASAKPKATLSQSAAAFGLTISTIEPADDGTKIVFDAVDFNDLIKWLADIQTTGPTRISTIEINRKPEPGIVSATLVVEESR